MTPQFEFRRIDCPTCGADDTRVWGQRGGRAHRGGAGEECTIVRCRRCDLLYANPFPFPKDLDALYSATEGFFDCHPDQATKTDDRAALIVSLERLTDGRRLLDVGAGTGETVAAAMRRGWDAYGVESAASFAEEAAKLSPGRIHHGSLEETPLSFLGEPYDAVVLAAVLEHLHDPNRVLGTISRILKPGGIMYVDVPNESGLYFTVGNLWNKLHGRSWVINLAPTFSPYHVFGFNKKSLTAILAKHGLQPTLWHIYGGRSVLPLLPSLRGLAEWLASKAVHELSKVGNQGTYIECYARKVVTPARPI